MAHVSSISNLSYPNRGTLLRLDTNGDGVLSREEIAAGQRPGLLELNAGNQSNDNSSALGNLVAKLMLLPTNGNPNLDTTDLMQPETDTAVDDDVDTQAAMNLYRGTYGQYAWDDMAA